ncbi:leucine-rich repeat protein [Bacteroidales bacterium OttesenSCG-928-M06]|nr:leucine-rich repeat protein [Bacteroidales bacterium OttesenSCG-928-M06]
MKTKSLFLTVILLIATFSANAQSGTCGTNLNWSFNQSTGELIITGSGNMDNSPVFGAPWFEYANTITSLSLPEGITSIGDNAFNNCESLSGTLTLPDGLTAIGSGAFENCRTLSGTLSIPNSVTTIGDGAFGRCTGLTGVTIGDNVIRIGAGAFSGCSGIETLTLGEELTSIGLSAFENCYLLTGTLTIPNGVTLIGINAFRNCYQLTNLILPDNPYSGIEIQRAAFDQCNGLTSITFGNMANTSIDEWVFSGCTGLTSIISNAEAPPSMNDINTFSEVPTDIPVTIPCGTYVNYVNSLWNYFDCLQGIRSEICMISVDGNNHNEIVWKKDTEVLGYNIYRESNVSGKYELVKTASYDESNMWTDTESNARMRSYRYKIASIINPDCDEETELSSLHKTMHLTINAGLNNSWNLIWTPYEGADFQTYNIYRTSSVGTDFELIGTMPSGNSSFSDFTAPAGYVYYMVEIVLAESCITPMEPFMKSAKASTGASIKSNIATNNPNSVGIEQIVDDTNNITICPNPTTDKLKIDNGQLTIGEVSIYDINGRKLSTFNSQLSTLEVDLSNYANGIYFIEVNNTIHKIIKK